jgi:tRNA threonylcarbamoyladenosine biosynthesis protein TsaB
MKAMSHVLIDTSQRNGWVGLSHESTIVFERSLDPSRGHARDLCGAIAAGTKEARINLTELSGMAINVGPGSFTGIRVALATAKAIAYAVGTKLIAIDTFDLVARDFARVADEFRVVVDFQLNGWLVCDFTRQGDGSHLRGEIRALDSARIKEICSAIPVCGPGVEKLAKQLKEMNALHAGSWVPSRDAFLDIALERTRSGKFADPFTIEPVYATMSSAEQLWQTRPNAPTG